MTNHIDFALVRHPNLTDYGFMSSHDSEFIERRAALERQLDGGPCSEKYRPRSSFAEIVTWIHDNFAKRKTINRDYTSYGLKHVAEPEIGYTSNGFFICAMIAADFEFRIPRDLWRDCNAFFNISTRSVNLSKLRQNESSETPRFMLSTYYERIESKRTA